MTAARAAGQVRSAVLETGWGPVRIHALSWAGEEPYVVLRHPARTPDVVLRVQAECLTGTAFASTMCDCRQQVEAGVRLAAQRPGGTFVYLPQEGRGYGLLSKVEIMAKMNGGRSLREAQEAVGRPDSRLSYHRLPDILRHLDLVRPVTLVTGSSAKVAGVASAGIEVAGTLPLES